MEKEESEQLLRLAKLSEQIAIEGGLFKFVYFEWAMNTIIIYRRVYRLK